MNYECQGEKIDIKKRTSMDTTYCKVYLVVILARHFKFGHQADIQKAERADSVSRRVRENKNCQNQKPKKLLQ